MLYELLKWGYPRDGSVAEAAALIVAELAANAATHGRVPGRDFEVRLALSPTRLRIEVSDTLTERRPRCEQPSPLGEFGRGLVLVAALADAWTVLDRPVGKTVQADVHLT